MGWESRKVGSLFGIGTIGSASLNVNASLKFKHSKSHCKHELSLSHEAVVWIKKRKDTDKVFKASLEQQQIKQKPQRRGEHFENYEQSDMWSDMFIQIW